MNRFAPFFVILGASMWGFDGIILRPSLYSLPVPLVVFLETSIVAVILTPFFFKKIPVLFQLHAKDYLSFVAVALVGGVIGTMSITKALFFVNYVNLSIVVLIQKLQPVFAIVLASIFLRERPSAAFFRWAGLALVGAYIMTFGFEFPEFHTGDKTTTAALFALLAAASFGSSTVFSKRALRNVDFELGTYFRFFIACIIAFVVALSFGDLPAVADVNAHQWRILLTIAFVVGGPAVFLYYFGLKRVPASLATICEMAFPLTAVLLEYFIHDNILSWVQWLGVFILFFSILKVTNFQQEQEEA